jgi:hypothetical protein
MRNDPDYLACMKAWKNGIGWSNKYTSEDVNSWIEAIDNQRAIIDLNHILARLKELNHVDGSE